MIGIYTIDEDKDVDLHESGIAREFGSFTSGKKEKEEIRLPEILTASGHDDSRVDISLDQ